MKKSEMRKFIPIQLLDAEGVCLCLSISQTSLDNLVSDTSLGFPAHVLLGKMKRWRLDDIENFIAKLEGKGSKIDNDKKDSDYYLNKLQNDPQETFS